MFVYENYILWTHYFPKIYSLYCFWCAFDKLYLIEHNLFVFSCEYLLGPTHK